MTTTLNPELTTLQTKLTKFQANNFFDNSSVIDFVKTLSHDGDVEFENAIRAILQINTNFFPNTDNNEKMKIFLNKFNIIRIFIDWCIETIKTDNDQGVELSNYCKKIKKVNIGSKPSGDTSTDTIFLSKQSDIITNLDSLDDMFKYVSTIEIDFVDLVQNYTIDTTSDENVLKNYIYMLLSFKITNMKTQIYATKYLFDLFGNYFNFFINAEKIILGKASSENEQISICNYFDETMVANVIYDETLVNSTEEIDLSGLLIGNSLNGQFTTSDQSTRFNDIPSENLMIVFEGETNGYYIKTHELNEKTGKYMFDLENPPIKSGLITFSLKQRPLKGLYRKKFVDSGQQLKDYNVNILDSKNKINSLVSKTKAHNDILDSLDKRVIVYYVCTAIILAIYIALMFIDKKDIRTYGAIVSFVIALLMNVMNSLMNNNSIIETFTGDDGVQCRNVVNPSSSISERQSFVQTKATIFTSYMLKIFEEYQLAIDTMDVNELFNKINVSIENEKKAFKGIDKLYEHKAKMNVSEIDIIKQEIVDKVAYLHLISSITMVLATVFILNLIEPRFSTYYYIAAILAFIYIFVTYLMTTFQTVNTKSSNKYWTDISDTTRRML